MVCDKAFLSFRAVFSSNAHAPVLFKQFYLEQVFFASCSEQECGFDAFFPYHGPHIQQRCHSHSTAYEEHPLRWTFGHGKSITEGQHAVELVACTE